MTIVENELLTVTGGIDTHLEFHVAAAVDSNGGVLGVETFDTTTGGYRRLVAWLAGFGTISLVGVEGTGSYGAGVCRHLTDKGIRVVEVDRPNRQARHRAGKTDAIDAIAAARAALTGTATGTPKTRTGNIEAIRVLTVARRSGANEWIAVLSQIRHVVFTAPDEIRAPSLLEVHGVGFDVAAKLLIAAGDNPHRIRSEAAWAHLCGVAPIPASSGKIQRHRLNRPATSTGRSWLRRTGSHLRGCASSDLPPDPAGGHLW